ncbi:DoxX family protein [Streptomyces sp. AJS327]|uniref:DoxX family protein n=1 Tax=Streptomyces sp. AJS327 TaxID=2545265 RepID=UPI0015E0543C|nr:DoxX family protein [Streptomyces sp. AJS327]MBA0054273.1 DoxX family protein [Streptomyces sp. AJS327]
MTLGDRTGGDTASRTGVGGIGGSGGVPGSVGRGGFLTGGLRAAAARHALLPLRLFLGVTFVYAGLDKLTDSAFLTGDGPGSLAQTLESVRGTAGAGWLVELAQQSPEGFGVAIALGELAVGVGTLLGLWARLAAVGGVLISLSLWLTVSWSSEPYYYGNDLPYLMAWIPLVLAGSPAYSVDALLALRRRRRGHRIFG